MVGHTRWRWHVEFTATCPARFEDLLAAELKELGAEGVRPLRGQVSFTGTLRMGLEVCLKSRFASRVVAVLARVDAADSDALYASLSSMAWEDELDARATFMVDAHGSNAKLKNTQYTAERAKDAIVDRIFARTGARPSVDRVRPDTVVSLRIHDTRAAVGIVLSGSRPLFERGWGAARSSGIRSDYAAALLRMSRWDCVSPLTIITRGEALAIEAALIASNSAPGLLRPRFGCEAWKRFDKALAGDLLDVARRERSDTRARIFVIGDDGRGVAAMRRRLRELDLVADIEAADPSSAKDAQALAIDASWLYEDALTQGLALTDLAERSLLASPEGCCAAILSRTGMAGSWEVQPLEDHSVLLGRDDAHMELVETGMVTARPRVSCKAPDGSIHEIAVSVPASDQFAARLAKVARERRKWAEREDISCYRVYDADLPDYAVALERYGSYGDARNDWLSIAEYAPPASVDPDLARKRLSDVVALAPTILGIVPRNVSLRTRSRARGGSQYAEEGSEDRHAVRIIDEGGLSFEVDFGRRLDCGIFLDHRETRAELREMMKQAPKPKRFLNLFAYTGTATCYAADGGALETTTVDLSRPSLDWARRNMERNGFSGDEHRFVQADVLAWVAEQRHARGASRYELVFCDVPTFSNSARMRKSAFDVQRDHAQLLIDVSRLLSEEGVCVFSCNLRSFKPDVEMLTRAGVEIEDITARTIPHDFERNPRIHRCYLVRRT